MAIRKKKSILIVNSVRKLAHNLSEKLSSMFDYSVSVVCSGIDALSHIQDGAHHVIIVDDTIIHSEGEDIFSKIHRAARCPVILMTSAMYAPCTIEFIEQ